MRAIFWLDGAAPESNRPSVGLPRRTGFEDCRHNRLLVHPGGRSGAPGRFPRRATPRCLTTTWIVCGLLVAKWQLYATRRVSVYAVYRSIVPIRVPSQ
jgi:hypothetical protein